MITIAVTAKLYTKAFSSLFSAGANLNGGVNGTTLNATPTWTTTTAATNQVKCMLLDNTYTPAQTTHASVLDVLASGFGAAPEISGTNYTSGGVVVSTSATLQETTSWFVLYANATWASASFTARYAVVYQAGPSGGAYTTAHAPLLLYVDFGANQTVSSGTFTVQWNASGTVAITVS